MSAAWSAPGDLDPVEDMISMIKWMKEQHRPPVERFYYSPHQIAAAGDHCPCGEDFILMAGNVVCRKFKHMITGGGRVREILGLR